MAGLIPQAFIDDLLSRIDIVDVIDKRIKLRKTGKNYSALCPFHDEKSPSFSVEPEKQFYYCFGCGTGGNALGFIMDHDQLDFPQAVENLASSYGLEVPREKDHQSEHKQAQNKQLYSILDHASGYFQTQLRHHSNKHKAVDYLKTRGLTGEIAKRFLIGYAPAGWSNLLADYSSSGFSTELLIKSGMILERDSNNSQSSAEAKRENCHDRFRNRIVFPIRDNRGRVIAFGGRVLGDDKPKYLNSPETPVFHKSRELYGLFEARKAQSKLSRVIIVEGYMDVVALAQHGISYAVATLGTATNSGHLSRLFRFVSEVIYCFDGDEAGRNAAWRALQITLPFMEDGRQVKFLFLPEGEDPDTLVRKIGNENFTAEIAQATHLDVFFFNKLSHDLDLSSMDGKAKLSSLAMPLIKQFPKGVFAQLMLDRLSELTGVQSQPIDEVLAPINTPDESEQVDDYGYYHAPSERDSGWQNSDSFTRRNYSKPGYGRKEGPRHISPYKKPSALKAIELLLRKPQLALSLRSNLDPLRSSNDENTDLLLELIDLVKDSPNTTTYHLLGHCYGTTMGSQLTQLMKNEQITPEEGFEKEFEAIIDNILSKIEKIIRKKSLLQQIKEKLKPTAN